MDASSTTQGVKGTAARGKGTIGWVYGFISNHLGDKGYISKALTDDLH
ncbi:transposase [Photobacterium minamisatsumaniensis]